MPGTPLDSEVTLHFERLQQQSGAAGWRPPPRVQQLERQARCPSLHKIWRGKLNRSNKSSMAGLLVERKDCRPRSPG